MHIENVARALSRVIGNISQVVGHTFFLNVFDLPSNRERDIRENLFQLRLQIRELEKSKISLADIADTDAVAAQVEKQLRSNIGQIVTEKLKDENTFVDSVDKLLIERLDQSIEKIVDVYVQNVDINAVLEAQNSKEKIVNDRNSYERLEEFVETERGNVSRLKSVMINLFVIFNISLLVGFFFLGDDIPPSVAYSVAASYFSLAAFIIYIVRTSHFRTGVLLSIRENVINQSKVYRYLESEKCGSPISENDVEVIKMLMTNRTEREHSAQHPYEVVLKQIEGSNIQFRGGRMQFGKSDLGSK